MYDCSWGNPVLIATAVLSCVFVLLCWSSSHHIEAGQVVNPQIEWGGWVVWSYGRLKETDAGSVSPPPVWLRSYHLGGQ